MADRVFTSQDTGNVVELNLDWDFSGTPTIVSLGPGEHPAIYNGDIPVNAHNDGFYNLPESNNPSDETNLVIGSSCVEIGDTAFAYCGESIQGRLDFPTSVKTIGAGAFYYCPGFTGELDIPDNITSVGIQAFGYCSNLTGLNIGNGLTSIEGAAFDNCTGLTGDLTIPDNITTIENGAFFNCTGFNGRLSLSNNLTTINYGAFSSNGFIGSLDIPDSITSIGEFAFFGNSGIKLITINRPSSVWTSTNALSGTTGLENIYVGDDYVTQYDSTWETNQGLGTVNIRNLDKFYITWYWDGTGFPPTALPNFYDIDNSGYSMRYQNNWDFSETITEGVDLPTAVFLPSTTDAISEYWLQTSLNDLTPNVSGLNSIDLSGESVYVKKLNLNQVRWDWKRIKLPDMASWLPDDTLLPIKIINGFEYLEIGNNDQITEIKFNCESEDIRDESSSDKGIIKLDQLTSLTKISFETINDTTCKINDLQITNCNALTGTLKLDTFEVGVNTTGQGDTSSLDLSNNTGIDSIKISSILNQKNTIQLVGCSNLTNILVVDEFDQSDWVNGIMYISGTGNDWRNCDFSIFFLSQMVRQLRGDPDNSAAANTIRIGGCPAWVTGVGLDPSDFLTPWILETATANNFTFVE